jgi:hypothetical protein
MGPERRPQQLQPMFRGNGHDHGHIGLLNIASGFRKLLEEDLQPRWLHDDEHAAHLFTDILKSMRRPAGRKEGIAGGGPEPGSIHLEEKLSSRM